MRTTDGNPTFLSAMVNNALAALLVSAIEDSIAEALWKPEQYEAIQRLLSSIDVLGPVANGPNLERAVITTHMQRLIRYVQFGDFKDARSGFTRKLAGIGVAVVIPRGVYYQNMTEAARLSGIADEGLDPAGHRVDARAIFRRQQLLEGHLELPASQYTQWARVMIPNYGKGFFATAKTCALNDMAIVACALERYRAAHRQYPERLEQLVPAFVERLPHDVFDGKPLRYQRLANGTYQLYSIGWNSSDDGGVMTAKEGRKPEWLRDEGDWVWRGVPGK